MVLPPDVVIAAVVSIFLFLGMCAALLLVVVSLRRPSTVPLIAATGIVILALIVVAVTPVKVPLLMGVIVGLLGTALAVVGGNPITRRVLHIATHGRVRDGDSGGIILDAQAAGTAPAPAAAGHEVMRGGTTIGYLERLAVVVAIIAGYPEAIAIVVAVKGVGRFSELAAAEARERFIIGTLSSLLWASVVGALVQLAIR